VPAVVETLHRLRADGVAIALDDFGTGYSSLTSLEQLPLTRLKLDRSLITSIDTSARSAAIAFAVIALCRSWGIAVTAEGIERLEQFKCLSANGSLCLQGYLFSRPVAGDDLMRVKANMESFLEDLLLSAPATTSRSRSDVARIAAPRAKSTSGA
jgi:EAL domain-containing protein (putative c-di-GMP-specific phosphodiesterase class I)